MGSNVSSVKLSANDHLQMEDEKSSRVEIPNMPPTRRKTITTFDNQMSRVSIVSIRYDSPINVGEDKSDITFEMFDLAMARVFTFLDITSLLMCSSACKKFRELENKYQDVLWQNLYKFHKTNMMYICTNPSQALQMMEETKKKHQASDTFRKGMERNELGLLVNDPILLELKKDVKNWKEECLNYYFVKRKFISYQQEYLLLAKLKELLVTQPENPTRRKSSVVGQNIHLASVGNTDSPIAQNDILLARNSDSSDSSDDFKFDSIDDDFLKKKSMEFMMYNNVKSSMIDDNPFGSDDEDNDTQKHNEEALNPNLNRWKEAESDSDDDNWLEDEKDDDKLEVDLKSPNQILQEKIGMTNSESEENFSTPLILRGEPINNSSIKHFEENSDEDEDWFNDDDEKSKDSSVIEPIVKKGERASEIESQTKLHVKNDFSALDISEVKIEISSENDNNKSFRNSSSSNHVTLKLPSIDDSDDENILGREASASEIKLVFADDLDSDKKKISTPKIKDESERSARSSFEEDIDDSRGSHKKSSFLISKSSNDDDSDPWYSDEESTKKTVLHVESENLNIKKEETDSDTDDWYSESEDDKKSSHFGLMLRDNEESQRDSSSCYSVSKLGFGSNLPSFIGSQSDTARRIKEAENLTLDELITDLTDVTKLKETYLNRSNAETQQFYSKLLSFHQRTQVYCGDEPVEDTMPDAMMAPNDWPTTLSFFQQKKGQGIVIKLIYVEEIQTPYPAKLCNPVLKFFGSKSKEMRSVCSGLIIGPFLLQWNKTHSLIIPRKLVSDSYLYQTRTHRIAELFNVTLDSIIDTIAKIIVEWNLTKLYHDQLQNCQHFVEKIIDSLGIKKVLETERIGKTIFNYNTILNREGKGSVEFNFSDQAKHDKLYACLEKKYGSGKVTFETHKQLDEFMRSVIAEDPNFTITHHQDYSLLVFFDQLFWAKHSLLPNEDQYKPLSDEKSSTLCPFGSLSFGTTK